MTKSPIRCSECKSTHLEPLADVVWNKETGKWEAQWVNLDEGHCFDCGHTRQYEKNEDGGDEMTKEQQSAIKCAYLDLLGAMEAMEAGDIHQHDWKAHRLTIDDLVEQFPFVEDDNA